MAYKKDIKPWLKDNGYTWEDMDNIWNECCEVNKTCKLLSEAGRNWSDLTMHQIKQLPTLKEDTIKKLQEKKEAEEKQAKLEEEARKQKEYYEENFESIMINKIENNEKLSEEELSRVVFDYEIEKFKGENRRWSRTVTSICALNNRLFMIDWEEGLTEYQDNSFCNQPVEVIEHAKPLRIISEVEYLTKDKYNAAMIYEHITADINDLSYSNISNSLERVSCLLHNAQDLLSDNNWLIDNKELAKSTITNIKYIEETLNSTVDSMSKIIMEKRRADEKDD